MNRASDSQNEAVRSFRVGERGGGLEALFDLLPDVFLFLKGRDRRFVKCNSAFVRLVGARSEDEVLGRSDADYFPPDLCQAYAADDDLVLAGGSIFDKVEIVRNRQGGLDWHSTTKVPVRSRRGGIVAVAGITRDIAKMASATAHSMAMAPVIETMLKEYGRPLSVAELAATVHLSVSQLERRFKSRFGTSPLQYLMTIRLDAASRLLIETDLPICDIAGETGFYDQSHFTNQFRRKKGMTPRQYRVTYGAGGRDRPRDPARSRGFSKR